MDKKVLNERLNELIRQIRLNSKDAHFAEKLTEDLLTVHRQKLHEKSYVFNLGEELYKIERNSFYISRHERGVLFHIYNSFDMVIPISNNALYGTLASVLIEHENDYATMTEEEKLDHDTFVEAIGIILSMPLTIFVDTEFAINIATQVIQRMDTLVKSALDQPLQEETFEEDAEFRSRVIEAESAKAHILEGFEALKDKLSE
jgi:hypothetical protein